MARSHPEIWLITENNVRRTSTGEEGLRETKNNVLGLANKNGRRPLKFGMTYHFRSDSPLHSTALIATWKLTNLRISDHAPVMLWYEQLKILAQDIDQDGVNEDGNMLYGRTLQRVFHCNCVQNCPENFSIPLYSLLPLYIVFFLPLETNYPSLAYEQPQNSPVSPPEQKSISPFFRMP